MTILNDKDIFIGALTGIVMHLIMWFTRIDLLSFTCLGECNSLMIFDMPISLIYFFVDEKPKIVFSLILGSLQWGIFGWMGIKILKYIETQIHSRKK